MFAVCVTFRLKPGAAEAFLPLMARQARNSLEREPGCLRFDVWTDTERPDAVFLYEIYDGRDAFDAHLGSDHFKTFDAASAPLVAEKTVTTWGEARQ